MPRERYEEISDGDHKQDNHGSDTQPKNSQIRSHTFKVLNGMNPSENQPTS